MKLAAENKVLHTFLTFPSTACGGKLTARNGVIESPNYPLNYPAHSRCEWQVEVSQHHQIVFEMADLNLESGYDCNWDYLEAYDLTEDDTEGERLFKVCGDETEDDKLLSSSSNMAVVRFISDDSVSKKGFRLHFHESCGQTVKHSAISKDPRSCNKFSIFYSPDNR